MWGVVCAICCALFLPPAWWLPLALVPAFALPASTGQHRSIDLGRREDSRGRDMAVQSALGFVRTAPAGVAMWSAGEAWWPLPLAGLLAGPAYDLAWIVRPHLPALGVLRHDPPAAGEVLFGGVIGAAIALGMLA